MCLTLYAKGQEDFKLANREQYDCRERAWKLCIWRDLMVSFLAFFLIVSAQNFIHKFCRFNLMFVSFSGTDSR